MRATEKEDHYVLMTLSNAYFKHNSPQVLNLISAKRLRADTFRRNTIHGKAYISQARGNSSCWEREIPYSDVSCHGRGPCSYEHHSQKEITHLWDVCLERSSTSSCRASLFDSLHLTLSYMRTENSVSTTKQRSLWPTQSNIALPQVERKHAAHMSTVH